MLGAFAGQIAIEQLALDAVESGPLRQGTRSEEEKWGGSRYCTYRESPDRYTAVTLA
jgi:hypothetical protein